MKNRVEEGLSCGVYVIQRSGVEQWKGKSQRNPNNFSLRNIKHEEKLIVYIIFSPLSTELDRGTAVTTKDVAEKKVKFVHSWGRRFEKEIVDVEGMWENREKYLNVLFFDDGSIEDFERVIIKRFRYLK